MNSCKEVLELLPGQVPLLPEETRRLMAHLSACHSCGEVAEELCLTVDVLHEQAAPPALSADLVDQLMSSLPAAPDAPGPRLTRSNLFRLAAAVTLFVTGALAAAWWAVSPERSPLPPQPEQAVRDPSPEVSAPEGASLGSYLQEAALVLCAVDKAEPAEPEWLPVVAQHVREAALVEQGQELLGALRQESDDHQLSDLLTRTHLILRRLRDNGVADAQIAHSLRRETRQAGVLTMCRALLEAEPAPPAPSPKGAFVVQRKGGKRFVAALAHLNQQAVLVSRPTSSETEEIPWAELEGLRLVTQEDGIVGEDFLLDNGDLLSGVLLDANSERVLVWAPTYGELSLPRQRVLQATPWAPAEPVPLDLADRSELLQLALISADNPATRRTALRALAASPLPQVSEPTPPAAPQRDREQDRVYLQNGDVLSGQVVHMSEEEFHLRTNFGVLRLARQGVAHVAMREQEASAPTEEAALPEGGPRHF